MKSKKLYFFVVIILIVLSMPNLTIYAKSNEITYKNLVGKDRYDTSILVSKEAYPEGTKNIILINGTCSMDGVVAETLAKKLSAPVLLISKNTLSKQIKTEISRLKPKKAYLIGGTNVIAKSVVNELKKMNISVERLYGSTQYTTAIAVAKKVSSFNKVIICNSKDNVQNGSAIAAIAAQNGIPILYNDSNSKLNTTTYNFLIKYSKQINTIYLVGNNMDIVQQALLITNGVKSIVKIKGATPYDINVNMIKKFNTKYNNIVLVNNPVDAISVNYLAAKNKSLLLYTGTNLTTNQKTLLKKYDISKIYYSGGEDVEKTAKQIASILTEGIRTSDGSDGYLNGTRLISNGIYAFPEYHQDKKVGKNYTLYQRVSYGNRKTLAGAGCNVFASSCVVSGILGNSSVEPISYLNNLKSANIWYSNNDNAFKNSFLEKYYGLHSEPCKSEAKMLDIFEKKNGKCAAIGYEYGHYIAIVPIMGDSEYKFYVIDSARGHTGKYKSGSDFINSTSATQFGVLAVVYQ